MLQRIIPRTINQVRLIRNVSSKLPKEEQTDYYADFPKFTPMFDPKDDPSLIILKQSPTLQEALQIASQQRRNQNGFDMKFPSTAFVSNKTKEENVPLETILKLTDRFDRLASHEDPDRLAMEIYGLQQEEMILMAYTEKEHPLKSSLLSTTKNTSWNGISNEYLWKTYPHGHSFFEPPYNKEISEKGDEFRKFEDDVIKGKEEQEREIGRKYEEFLTEHGGLRKKVGRRTKFNRAAGKELRKLRNK